MTGGTLREIIDNHGKIGEVIDFRISKGKGILVSQITNVVDVTGQNDLEVSVYIILITSQSDIVIVAADITPLPPSRSWNRP